MLSDGYRILEGLINFSDDHNDEDDSPLLLGDAHLN